MQKVRLIFIKCLVLSGFMVAGVLDAATVWAAVSGDDQAPGGSWPSRPPRRSRCGSHPITPSMRFSNSRLNPDRR